MNKAIIGTWLAAAIVTCAGTAARASGHEKHPAKHDAAKHQAAKHDAGAKHAEPAVFAHGMLVDHHGMTLYTFDPDVANSGKSVCNDGCIAAWPALVAGKNDKAVGKFSVVTRDDGSHQWAYEGKPLYLWVQDKKAGDVTGDGFNKIWHIVKQH
ncbi:MAG: hypothetical protein VKO64_10970 [Candidatus Sericytochromatia bacterium]|nr:hypothetical protein [Candidatus Sericytochromatia bacterium]